MRLGTGVYQQVALARLIGGQRWRHRVDELGQVAARMPGTHTSVYDQRHYGGQGLPGLEGGSGQQVFIQQAAVGRQPQGHGVVGARLEFEHEYQEQLMPVFARNTPDQVAMAALQGVADEFAAHRCHVFQGQDISPAAIQRRDDIAQQAADDAGLAEQQFVAVVGEGHVDVP